MSPAWVAAYGSSWFLSCCRRAPRGSRVLSVRESVLTCLIVQTDAGMTEADPVRIASASWREATRSLPAVCERSDGEDGRTAGSGTSECGSLCADAADAAFFHRPGDADPAGTASPRPAVQGQSSALPGRPDIAFTAARIAVFVDGCFWHACPDHRVFPKNNREWWRDKLERNVARDREKDAQLDMMGWTWCMCGNMNDPPIAADAIEQLWRSATQIAARRAGRRDPAHVTCEILVDVLNGAGR